MKKQAVGILLSFLLAATALAGCGREEEPVQEAVVEEATPEPEETPEPEPIEALEAEPEPTEEPSGLPEGMMYSQLTGEVVDTTFGRKRPFAIMINNIIDAVPQSGIIHADILYEAYVESQITRLMAVFQDVTEEEKIGPVRSSRHYYLDFADDYDAIYTHHGWSYAAEYRIEVEGRTTINGSFYDNSFAFFRTSDRVAPHNSYVKGDDLVALSEQLGFDRNWPDTFETKLAFHQEDTEPSGDDGAVKVVLPYPVNNPWFEYHEDDKQYYRFEYGEPHVDMETGEQLRFKNIVVQFVPQTMFNDDPILLDLQVFGSGTGLYFSDGKAMPITWEKSDPSSGTTFYDAEGNVLQLNPGKTMFQIAPPEMQVSWEDTEGQVKVSYVPVEEPVAEEVYIEE